MKRGVLIALLGALSVAVQRLLVADPPPFGLRVLTALLGLLSLIAARRSLLARSAPTHHGSAGFAARQELADLFVPEGIALTPGSMLLGTAHNQLLALPLQNARQHGIVVGGSGTGKSFSFFLPNAAFAHNTSLIATDPKSELWKRTSGLHDSTRYAPADPEASACLNWIPLCTSARIAELCARAIVSASGGTQEPPWEDLEVAFLASLFSHTATLAVPTPLTAYNLLTRSDPETLLARFLASASPAAREQAIIFQQTHERMRGSITPVLAAKLQFMRDPAIQRFTSASLGAPDFGRLRVSPQSVYWCLEEQHLVRLRGLSALFFTLLLEQLAAEGKQSDASVPIVCLLDEFGNLGVLPNYASTISLSRGRGVALWHGVQSLSQLEASYGKATAQTILANCATKVVLSGADVDTAEYFSRALGPKTQSAPRQSRQKRRFALFATSVSDTVQEFARPLHTGDEVRRLPATEAILLTGNRRPVRLTKTVYNAAPCTAPTTPLVEARTVPIEFALPASARASPPSPPPLPSKRPEVRVRERPAGKETLKFTARKSQRTRATWIEKTVID